MNYDIYDWNEKRVIDRNREGKDEAAELKRLRRKAERLGMKYGSHNRYRVRFNQPS